MAYHHVANRAALAAGFGGKLERPRLRLRSWRRISKGALVGVAGVSLPVGGAELEIDDIPVLVSAGKFWAAMPGKPIVTQEGTLARIPGTSKPRYVSILRWRDRETSTRFSQAVVALVRETDPEAFTGEGQQ